MQTRYKKSFFHGKIRIGLYQGKKEKLLGYVPLFYFSIAPFFSLSRIGKFRTIYRKIAQYIEK